MSVRIGLAAAADLAGGLDHHHLASGSGDPPRRCNAGRAGADRDNVSIARQRRRSGLVSPGTGRSGQPQR